MTTPTPTLNGQVIGEAENAIRAVLDRLLRRVGNTFHQWVALNSVAIGGGSLAQQELVDRMIGGLKVDEAPVRATIAELLASGLLEQRGSRLGLTPLGDARHREIRAGIGEITARLYADLPTDDLAAAGRVLTVLTARANAELAAAG